MSVKQFFAGSLACVSLMLSGCSSEKSKADNTTILGSLVSGITSFGKKSAKPVDPRTQLTRQAIDAAKTPVLFAEVKSRGAYATLGIAGTNNGIVTWISADNISLSFRQGVLVATRGLGHDLMAANVSPTLAALKTGSGTASRINEYLNGENHIVRANFNCSIHTQGRELLNIVGLAISTRHVVENCQSADSTLENHYWISAGNKVVQSKQWIGPNVEYIFIQQLSR